MYHILDLTMQAAIDRAKSRVDVSKGKSKDDSTIDNMDNFLLFAKDVNNTKKNVKLVGRIFDTYYTSNSKNPNKIYIVLGDIDNDDWNTNYDALKNLYTEEPSIVKPELVGLTCFQPIPELSKSTWFPGTKIVADAFKLSTYKRVSTSTEEPQANIFNHTKIIIK